ncbi:hypothetical protein FI667_g14647, partial [Globisporangium splendens]
MKLKFPLSQPILPPLELSEDDKHDYVALARRLVGATLDEYGDYNRRHQVVRSQWKPVKRRENLTVYKETKAHRHKRRASSLAGLSGSLPQSNSHSNSRSRSQSRSSSSHSSAQSYATTTAEASAMHGASEWVMPRLLMVGTIVGTLDDVMYGLSTFDPPSMLLNTSYMGDEVIDAAFLSKIVLPTPEEPYRFVGIKWIVKDNPPVVNSFVSPRDLLYLESKGIWTLPNGDRVGHHLMHSLDIPGYGPLPSNTNVLRGRLSSCILYKQLANNTVDVFMTTNFEPNGSTGEFVSVMSAANGLIYCWRSVLCAHNKKLAWLLRNRRRKATFAAGTGGSILEARESCGTCGKVQGKFRHLSQCQLCAGPMCSRCRVDKKLSFTAGSGVKQIRQIGFQLCTTCVSNASHTNAFVIAREEILSGSGGSVPYTLAESEYTVTSSMTAGSMEPSFEDEDDPLVENLIVDSGDSEDEESHHSHRVASKHRFSFESHPSVMGSPDFQSAISSAFEERETLSESASVIEVNPLARTVHAEPLRVAPYPATQEQLWRQMAQLNMAAETVYQYTKRTGETHLRGGVDASGPSSSRGALVRSTSTHVRQP